MIRDNIKINGKKIPIAIMTGQGFVAAADAGLIERVDGVVVLNRPSSHELDRIPDTATDTSNQT